MATRIDYVSHDALVEYTIAFREYNDGRYSTDGGGTGVASYDDLDDLPSLEGVTIRGAKSAHDYGLALEADIPDLDGYATSEEVGDAIADAVTGLESQLGGYATKGEIADFITEDALSGYATKGDVDDARSSIESELGSYATNASLDAVKSDVRAIDAKFAGYATTDALEGVRAEVETVDVKLAGYAKSSDLDGLASVSYVDSSVGAVDAKLSGYATKGDISSFQTAAQVDAAIESKTASLATSASVDALRDESEKADESLQDAISKKQDALAFPGDASKYLDGSGKWSEIASTSPYAVGQEIVSTKTLSPGTLYGGTWQLDSSTHLFRGVYIYTRIS